MSALNHFLKTTVTSCLAVVMFSIPLAAAEQARLDRLFAELKEAAPEQALVVAKEIELEWSKSGSAAMDLLLRRGWDALEAGETAHAIEHFTAVTDHAPDFAEAWHARAVAYTRAQLYGPAIADLERALALSPRHFNAIYGLGVILEEMGRPEMAQEAYEAVLDIHPHQTEVQEALKRLAPQLSGQDI